jgi:hypothetical protein
VVAVPASREGAVYCRAAHRRSREQFGVDQREAACRALAQREGVRVAARRVFVEPRSTAWSRDELRPTWQQLLAATESGQVTDVVLFDAPELQRHQPWDFALVLAAAERRGLSLLDPTGAWDLNDPAWRRELTEQTRQLCRRREESSARQRSHDDRSAGSGLPHGGGRRAYGYSGACYDLVPFEASVVSQIFSWFVEGRTLTGIAVALNRMGVETAYGSAWSASGVARIVDAPRYAGLRVVRGQVARAPDGSYEFGEWKPCVALAVWETARVLRRRQTDQSRSAPHRRGEGRHYPLTGLVHCGLCGRRMVGSLVERYPTYACAGGNASGADRCRQHISADRLEELVDLRVVRMLEQCDPGPPEHPPAAAVLDRASARSRAVDQARLAELQALPSPPPAETARLTARIREVNRSVVVRAGDALDDLATGRQASATWRRLSPARRAEVRRFLLARIRIGALAGPRSVFDPGRVEIAPNPS